MKLKYTSHLTLFISVYLDIFGSILLKEIASSSRSRGSMCAISSALWIMFTFCFCVKPKGAEDIHLKLPFWDTSTLSRCRLGIGWEKSSKLDYSPLCWCHFVFESVIFPLLNSNLIQLNRDPNHTSFVLIYSVCIIQFWRRNQYNILLIKKKKKTIPKHRSKSADVQRHLWRN